MAKTAFKPQRAMWSKLFTYDYWMESIGIPIHRGYYVEDLRNLELGWWEERQCMSAFIQLAGQEGVSSARVTEIAPGQTLPPLKFALDEVVYVAQGRGLTTIWYDNGGPRKSFEWQPHSMFLLPHGCHHQFSNMQGDRPARMLHYSYLPLGMSAVPDPDFFFNNSHKSQVILGEQELYSEAKMIQQPPESNPYGRTVFWYGNFFPDMRAWDKLDSNARRGAGGRSVAIQFPNSEVFAHMSVFGAQTYKKAHRHGPGRVIVIPAGDGYSIMWEEGKEKVVVPWHECSAFVPPNRWFHQHFNVGGTGARYLALHSPMQFYGHAEKVEDRAKDQIEYPDEDPWIRKKFEEELGKRGLRSLMPAEAYVDRDYEWSKAMGKR
ncbi:MAG TPA: cupin domain-containing protein [Candidatus Binatia bacterium]|nr:cupin domain-containing protein [Candidatus Binatia bacterium]